METKPKHTRNQSAKIVKVVLYGPESTGKTTLANQLAEYYKTSLATEYMREYLQNKWDLKKELVTKDDLILIANGQLKLEEVALQKANKLLICDTNLLELKVYSEYYYDGFCPAEIKEQASKCKYDIYLLTYIDTPWQLDDLRDRPNDREKMFDIFEAELKMHNLPYQILKGNKEDRFDKAVKIIDKIIQ